MHTTEYCIYRFTPSADREYAFAPVLNLNASRKRGALIVAISITAVLDVFADSHDDLMGRFLMNTDINGNSEEMHTTIP